MSVAENLRSLSSTLPLGCKLIAVSKTHAPPVIQEAYDAGQRIFGENKVQELVPKYEALPKDIEWHLIGHLQTNKVKYVVPFVALIHSVDSYKLLHEINKQAEKNRRQVQCLLQVHIAEEETKFGLSEREVREMLRTPEIKKLEWISVQGLMGMATLTEDQDQIRKEFRKLRSLFDGLGESTLSPNVKMKELSMGMSSDYKIAVEEGSTMIRVGSAIFGQRNASN